jgi:ABC-type multidrug transport system fused ATPase/permease subunit
VPDPQHYTLIAGHRLTPSVAFTAVAVFAELRYALNALPETFIEALQGFVSCRRIEKYLAFAEVAKAEPYDGDGDITLVNATFTWPRDDSTLVTNGVARSTPTTPKNAFSLADVTVRFPARKLSLICGRLGESLLVVVG